MVTVFTTWRETCGNGAATGIVRITTRRWPIKVTWRTIRRDRIRLLTEPSPKRRSACIEAARSSATINTVHATLLGRAAKERSTPEQITLVSAAFDRSKISRNKQRRIRFFTKRRFRFDSDYKP